MNLAEWAKQALEAPLDERSLLLRRHITSAMLGGGRGHLGPACSLVEILRALYDDVMNFAPEDPGWPERDRCILSKGHGCLALYAVLADKGFFPIEELEKVCRPGSILGGHPERVKVPGVEASTGALGHGLAIGVGMALAARMQQRKSRVFVVVGDGEINEGSVWESAMSASKHALENLTVVVDYNKIQSYGPVNTVQPLEPLSEKFEAFGFTAREVAGHDVSALSEAFKAVPLISGKPSALICHTVKGKGIPEAENNPLWHHISRISDERADAMRTAVGWIK